MDEQLGPVDPDHKQLWDAVHANTDGLAALRNEISVNGYADILKEIARRYKQRREVWQFFKRPRMLIGKAFWVALGGAAVAGASYLIHH